jgi:two-component system, chemotaxis family, chemotaxis protein CheY
VFKPGSKFLIVDDSNIVRNLLRTALSQLDHKNVDVAPDGRQGLKFIDQSVLTGEPYDLVFCDLNMPHVDGFKFLEVVRSTPQTRDLPVIIVTTENAKALVIKAVMHGVAGFMVKPFGVEDVKNKIQEVYKRIEK